MLYVKSVFFGVLAFVASAILYIVILYFLQRPHSVPPGTEVSLDLRAVLTPLFWLITLAAFALAFYWGLRKG
jgi:hypothetical protein